MRIVEATLVFMEVAEADAELEVLLVADEDETFGVVEDELVLS